MFNFKYHFRITKKINIRLSCFHATNFDCIREIIQLIIMKMKMNKENRSYRYDINRPRFRHGHKYSKYKKCLSMMMLICIKQHLNNICSS